MSRYVEPFLGGGAVLLGLLSEHTSPFLRWAGGKRRLYPEIKKRLGTVTFDHYIAADLNEGLIAAWQSVRDDVEAVIEWLMRHWPHAVADYHNVRNLLLEDRVEKGAQMVFLNLFAFNGLHRVNRAGRFNVPCDKARLEKVKLVAVAESLRTVSHAVRENVTIMQQSFEETLYQCGLGDVVYCDPPYLGTFTNYSGPFDGVAQQRLIDHIYAAVIRGARVVASNSMLAKPLYDYTLSSLPGYRCDVVTATRSISCKGGGRGGGVEEILVTVGR